jgi:hypothetical protein
LFYKISAFIIIRSIHEISWAWQLCDLKIVLRLRLISRMRYWWPRLPYLASCYYIFQNTCNRRYQWLYMRTCHISLDLDLIEIKSKLFIHVSFNLAILINYLKSFKNSLKSLNLFLRCSLNIFVFLLKFTNFIFLAFILILLLFQLNLKRFYLFLKRTIFFLELLNSEFIALMNWRLAFL